MSTGKKREDGEVPLHILFQFLFLCYHLTRLEQQPSAIGHPGLNMPAKNLCKGAGRKLFFVGQEKEK